MAVTARTPPPTATSRSSPLTGLAAAAIALGVSALVAVPFGSSADARTAVGSSVIDLTPGPVKEWAIQTFGTADKLFLSAMVLIVIGTVAAVAAQWERSRIPVGSVVIAMAALAGSAAVLSRAGASVFDVVPTLIGAACGVVVLRFLTSERFTGGDVLPPRSDDGETSDRPANPGRRLSLAAMGFVGVGVLSGVFGAVLSRNIHSVSGDREAFEPPPIEDPIRPVPANVQPDGVALPSFVTSNADFYRIDTALSVPQLSRNEWQLKIHGMVDREITYRFDDLAKFDLVEKMVTLTCVSNPVGGDLVSNAVWTGYRVRDLLAAAGIHPDADMVMSTSTDGFTAGTPVEALTDDREALLAITMNGQPLPVEHGYPARLVVPGLYGYVSATKWVVDWELTRFDAKQGYWVPRGWSAKGPIKTQSRIDSPRGFDDVPAGRVVVAGIAWAQHTGVDKVEVRTDGGQWQPAELATEVGVNTWRMWRAGVEVGRGEHRVEVRATDRSGYTQTDQRAAPAPDGATGWHSVIFNAR
jgi:DMSO/TMAO reductase YedYZ molybdopterin-dependent catalytic subunit